MATQVVILKPKPCDICAAEQRLPVPNAAVDGRTINGPWANMCDVCWLIHGVGKFGTGYGQRLILKES